MPPLSFELLATDASGTSCARRGRITTPHGVIETPVFMPVGTFGAVRTLDHEELEACGTQIILGNTYHLYLRPGPDILQTVGGLHRLIAWDKPILTDSGGFQIFSLPRQRTLSERGARFQSYVDMSYKSLTPEVAIGFQELLGSDIMMALDVCVPSTSDRDTCIAAMERTHRWARRCMDARTRSDCALFGIVQGAVFEDLRQKSAEHLISMGFDGYAIGGLAVGETDEERDRFTRFTAALLPADKPRYLMGVGTPHDLVRSVAAGVDMFDCIIPHNHARQGLAYTYKGKVHLRRTAFAKDVSPIDSDCGCYVCKRYNRAHLHQLVKCKEPTGWKLIGYHNTHYYMELMDRLRREIERGSFSTFAASFLAHVPD